MKEKFKSFMFWIREYIWIVMCFIFLASAIINSLNGNDIASYSQSVAALVCLAVQWIVDEIKKIRFKF